MSKIEPFVVGDVKQSDFFRFVRFVDELEEDDEPTIIINSSGGSGEASLAIHDYMLESGLDFTVKCYGVVESAAVTILMAGTHKVCSPHTSFMVHKGKVVNGGVLGWLEHRKKLNMFNGWVNNILGVVTPSKTKYLTPQEAKDCGFVSEILDI